MSKPPVRKELDYSEAMELALRRLDYSAISSNKMRQYLLARVNDEQVILQVLDRLEDIELLDDFAYGKALLESRMATGKYSLRELHTMLLQRGISADMARILLENIEAEDYEKNVVQQLVQKKIKSLMNLDRTQRRQRIYQLLQRKGLSFSKYSSTVNEILDELEIKDDI